MATNVQGTAAGRPQRGYLADQGFFVRYAIVLAIFILIGFAQFTLRGFSSPWTAPPIVHLHGATMIAWLGIFIAQNMLVHRGELAIHRKLGWLAAGLLALITVTGLMVGYNAAALGRQPPFWTAPYFLALTWTGSVTFAAMVVWGVALRRQVQWHRRAMLGAMFVLLEPALGRLLPMPLLGVWGEWVTLLCQLLFVAVLARHDGKVLGSVHPATKMVALVLIASHVVFETLAVLPPWVAYAQAVAAG